MKLLLLLILLAGSTFRCGCPTYDGKTVKVAVAWDNGKIQRVPVSDLLDENGKRKRTDYYAGCVVGPGPGRYKNILNEPAAKKKFLFGSHRFDPWQQLPIFSEKYCSKEMPETSIVQFERGALTPPLRDCLQRNGISLDLATSNLQFEVDSSKLVKLARLVPPNAIQWIVPLQPGFKPEDTVTAAGVTEILVEAYGTEKDFRTLEDNFRRGGFLSQIPRRRTASPVAQLKVYTLPLSLTSKLPSVLRERLVRKVERLPEFRVRGVEPPQAFSGHGARRRLRMENLTGKDQVLGIIDDGLDIRHCFFSGLRGDSRESKVVYLGGQIPRSSEADYHGTYVVGLAAGQDVDDPTGQNRGLAPEARVVFTPLGTVQEAPGVVGELERDSGGGAEEPAAVDDMDASASLAPRRRAKNQSKLSAALEKQAEKGATILSNSWGDDSCRTPPKAGDIACPYRNPELDIDRFSQLHEDDLVVVAVSNQGQVAEPENAKNALAVAASRGRVNAQNEVEFGRGASGPTDDGRMKPEILAPGCGVVTAAARTACDVEIAQPEDQDESCATSWAAPQVAGGAVQVREFFERGFFPSGKLQGGRPCQPTGALVKAVLLNATENVDEGNPDLYPSPKEGWGLLNLERELIFDRKDQKRRFVVLAMKNAEGLRDGESPSFKVRGKNLKATLVWMDPAPFVASSGELINDLDLIVQEENGPEYCGNQFYEKKDQPYSKPCDETKYDTLNNVEQVVTNDATQHVFTITVRASSITIGPNPRDPRQGFALVVSGDNLSGGRRSADWATCSNVEP